MLDNVIDLIKRIILLGRNNGEDFWCNLMILILFESWFFFYIIVVRYGII